MLYESIALPSELRRRCVQPDDSPSTRECYADSCEAFKVLYLIELPTTAKRLGGTRTRNLPIIIPTYRRTLRYGRVVDPDGFEPSVSSV